MDSLPAASTPFRLLVPDLLFEGVLEHALRDAPNECCGFLAGVRAGGEGRVTLRLPLPNAAASPVLYDVTPADLFAAERELRRHGLEVLAVYHSHPTSAPVPSRTDRERRYGEQVACLIVSLAGPKPEAAAWWLSADAHRQAAWEVVGDGLRPA